MIHDMLDTTINSTSTINRCVCVLRIHMIIIRTPLPGDVTRSSLMPTWFKIETWEQQTQTLVVNSDEFDKFGETEHPVLVAVAAHFINFCCGACTLI